MLGAVKPIDNSVLPQAARNTKSIYCERCRIKTKIIKSLCQPVLFQTLFWCSCIKICKIIFLFIFNIDLFPEVALKLWQCWFLYIDLENNIRTPHPPKKRVFSQGRRHINDNVLRNRYFKNLFRRVRVLKHVTDMHFYSDLSVLDWWNCEIFSWQLTELSLARSGQYCIVTKVNHSHVFLSLACLRWVSACTHSHSHSQKAHECWIMFSFCLMIWFKYSII